MTRTTNLHGPSGKRISDATSTGEEARLRLVATLSAMRPEREAGGFTRDDGTVGFYSRVNALLNPRAVLLDLGCGRGRQFDVPDPGYAQDLQRFQGRVQRVIGIDVHDGVREHPYLDEWHVISPSDGIPIASDTVDIVVADWLLEHIEQPARLASEMERIIRAGGWFCARTVNRWSYIGVGARLMPNRLHGRLVRQLIPVARIEDVFPTLYRLNSLRAVRRWFPDDKWHNCSYVTNTTPRYFGSSRVLFRAIELYQRLTPRGLGTDLLIFLRRR